LNQAGKLTAEMLTRWDGNLPKTKILAFWMEYQGENYSANWSVNVIK